MLLNVGDRHAAVLRDIMQHCRGYALNVLLQKGKGIGRVKRMLDVGLSGQTHLTIMSFSGEVISTLDRRLGLWRKVFAGFLQEIDDFHVMMIHHTWK